LLQSSTRTTQLTAAGRPDERRPVGFSARGDGRSVSPDGRHATVRVACRGTEREEKESMAALDHARYYFRHELATRLDLRYVPEIRFIQDKNADVESPIDFLLKRGEAVEEL
jgi:ribosome-binding factor A